MGRNRPPPTLIEDGPVTAPSPQVILALTGEQSGASTPPDWGTATETSTVDASPAVIEISWPPLLEGVQSAVMPAVGDAKTASTTRTAVDTHDLVTGVIALLSGVRRF